MKRCEQGTGNTLEAQALVKRWRHRGPSSPQQAIQVCLSSPGSPSDPKTNRTMIWDNECRMVDDPEAEARKILLA